VRRLACAFASRPCPAFRFNLIQFIAMLLEQPKPNYHEWARARKRRFAAEYVIQSSRIPQLGFAGLMSLCCIKKEIYKIRNAEK
jgi:hypothetical protein